MPSSPQAIAHDAGLHYVTDASPGIRRIRHGKGFHYVAPSGRAVRDATTLERIRRLAIPPAYRDVWICTDPQGHLQATGRDARGRKQYRYHPKWRSVRDATKFERMLAFAQALPRIRRRIAHDLALPGIRREKILAAVVRLLETTTVRVGNDEYARENDSYGLTTMRNEHAKVAGDRVTFSFRGKHGLEHAISLRDKQLAKIVRACQEIPGQDLFGYVDDAGTPRDVKSSDVNAYIREVSHGDFSAKDFRTWVGTVTCASLLALARPAPTRTVRKRMLDEAVKCVAASLGNTPAVCRKCYIHPRVLSAYAEEGVLRLSPSRRRRAGLSAEEWALVDFLSDRSVARVRKRSGPAQRSSARSIREAER